MKKIFMIILLFTQGYSFIQAQTPEDALRFSRVFYSGTARFNGLGGAFGAVGADFSTLATNPAGLGLYSASEMSFTLAPTIGYSSSEYNGTNTTDYRVNCGIGNFGVVFNIKPYKKANSSAVKAINIGFGINRQNDFNNRVAVRGLNMESSLMQSYANTMNSENIPQEAFNNDFNNPFYRPDLAFDLGLAYNTNLVYFDSLLMQYRCDAAHGGVTQDKTIETRGSMNEADFSVGANISDRFFIGMTFGVPSINYYENSTYRETRAVDTLRNFRSLNYQYNLHTRGTGINFKLGVIGKPVDWFRISAAIHTPTWYPSMRDEWYSSMQSSFDTAWWDSFQSSPLGNYRYSLTTPFKALGGIAFIIGKFGLVSADYEYINYSQARFHSSDDSYSDVNSSIKSDYKSWGNIRVGTEWRVSNFSIRGGIGYFSNPYQGSLNRGERYQVSGGLGYRTKHFFADVTYVWSKMTQDYYLYDASLVNPASISYYTNTVSTTVGFRF